MANGQIKHTFHRVILEAGSTVTPTINIYGGTLVGIITPEVFESATMTVLAGISADASNFSPVVDAVGGSALTLTTAADKYAMIDPAKTYGLQYFRLQVAAATIIAADRELIIITRPFA